LDREVVKTENAVITIPDFEFEIPASTQKGTLNTIQGFLSTTIESLQFHQNERKEQQPEIAKKLDIFLQKLQNVVDGKTLPFKFILDDPSGNSFVENTFAPNDDPNMKITYYKRTDEQNEALGLQLESEKDTSATEEAIQVKAKQMVEKLNQKKKNNNKNKMNPYKLKELKLKMLQNLVEFVGLAMLMEQLE